jgi:hypothetical protein
VRRHLGLLGFVTGTVVLYSAWMTGCTFSFGEIERFPNHQMLARAFADGRTWISEQPRVDVVLFEGKTYLYFGPVPSALRTPLALLGVDVPTGLMVVLLGTAVGLVFVLILRELAPRDGPHRTLRRGFAALIAGNGITLFMVALPSVHHEAILWAALSLLVATLGVLRTWRTGPTLTVAAAVGVAAAAAVGSRISYLLPCLVLIGAFVAAAYSRCTSRQRVRVISVAVAPLVMVVALLAAYNSARFGSATDFGLDHLTSRYQDYIREGHFWRLDHVPYNLWDYLGRPPQVRDEFPFLEATISMQEVTRRTATPQQPYRLLHVNELAVSVFIVLPVLVLVLPALGLCRGNASPDLRRPALLFATVAVVQLALLSLTIASTARYQFDFVPHLMALAFVGAVALQDRFRRADRLVVALVVISLLLGLFLPLCAVEKYEPFVGYRSPLLDLVGSAR